MQKTMLATGAAILGGIAILAGHTHAGAIELPCGAATPTPDAACALAVAQKSPVRTREFWRSAFDKPVTARIGAAPRELAVFIAMENVKDGLPQRPAPATLAPDFEADVKAAFATLPAHVLKLVEKKLAGIYFVNDLGGTGFSDYADQGNRRQPAGWIALDAGVLASRTANAWATWKESTPFRPQPGHVLRAVIEAPAEDTRRQAIQYILLHELGHILSIGEDAHPRWDEPPKRLDGFPFADTSWEFVPGPGNEPGRYVAREEARFPLRRDVVYYFGAKLDARDADAVYQQLAQTSFPTLYAATRPGDDFAESFASYVHTVLMKRPWEIHLTTPGKPDRVIGTCWEEARCQVKRRRLEALMGIRGDAR